ncbi:hypothetical protein HY522_00895 [bacterium]|nr:hypothetical protein [bacterium]
MSIEGAPNPPALPFRRAALLLLCLTAVSYFSQQGDFYLKQSATVEEVLLKVYFDAGEISLDHYSEGFFSNWPTFYALLPSWLYRTCHVDPNILMESMGFLLILLSVCGIYALARAWKHPDPWLPVLAAAYFVFSDAAMSGPAYHAQTTRSLLVAYYGVACSMLTLAALMAGRYPWAGFCIGLTLCAHPGYAAVSLAVIPLAVLWKEKSNPNLARIFWTSFLAGLVGSLPYLIFILPTPMGSYANWGAAPIDQVIEMLKIREPHHSYPSEWHPSRYLVFLLLLAMSWAGAGGAGTWGRGAADPAGAQRPDADRQKIFRVLAVTYLVFLSAAFVFVEIFPVFAVIKFGPFRAFSPLTVLLIVPFFFVLYAFIVNPGSGIYTRGLAAWILCATFFSQDALPVIPIGLILVELYLTRSGHPSNAAARGWRIGLSLVAFVLPLAAVALPADRLPFPVSRIFSFLYLGSYLPLEPWQIGVVVFGMAAGAGIPELIRNDLPGAGRMILVGLMVGLCLAKSAEQCTGRLARDEKIQAFRDVQDWAYRSTPKDAEFLVDPLLVGFRTHARRDVFFEWADVSFMRMNPFLYEEIMNRFEALTLTISEFKPRTASKRAAHLSARFSDLPPETIRRIGKTYPRVAYAVYQNSLKQRFELPIVFQNRFYTICKIDPAHY